MTTCRIHEAPGYQWHFPPLVCVPPPLLLFGLASVLLHCLVLAIPVTLVTPGHDRMQTASRLDINLSNGEAHQPAPAAPHRHHARTHALAHTHQQPRRAIKWHKPVVSVHAIQPTQEWFQLNTHSSFAATATPAAPAPARRQHNTDKPTPNPSAVALLLRQALLQHFRYPVIARQNAWQGKVILNVRVEADGRVGNARVIHPSAYAILDRAARRAASAIGVIPAARPLLAGQSLSFRVPVAYRLQP